MKHSRRSQAIWTTAEGRKIRVRDMTDQHLKNAIAFLERQAECRVMLLSNPFSCDTEAYYAAEHAIDELIKDPALQLSGTIYDILVEERNCRNE